MCGTNGGVFLAFDKAVVWYTFSRLWGRLVVHARNTWPGQLNHLRRKRFVAVGKVMSALVREPVSFKKSKQNKQQQDGRKPSSCNNKATLFFGASARSAHGLVFPAVLNRQRNTVSLGRNYWQAPRCQWTALVAPESSGKLASAAWLAEPVGALRSTSANSNQFERN